jgi:Domain of unknown function (DUF4412)
MKFSTVVPWHPRTLALWSLGNLALCLALASPAAADVTTKHKSSGKGMGGMMSGEMTQYVKGLKMRTDQNIGGQETTTIMDVAAKQMIVLNHAKKEATVFDMTSMSANLAKLPVSEIKASITPTAQTRQIAGATCTVYDVKVTAPMSMRADAGMTLVMGGPHCLVKNGPGQADYTALYRAVAKNGFFIGDPAQANVQPAQAKAMTEMYSKMAELGVPYAAEMNITFEGSGPMAAMMSKMGGNSFGNEITSVSTAPIPDSTFEVPAGYKVNKRP